MTEFVVHTKCCNGHWELGVDKTGKLHLFCPECRIPIGPMADLEFEADVPPMAVDNLKPQLDGAVNCMHSPCCKDHWEILVDEDGARLVCAKCHRTLQEVKVALHVDSESVKCEKCGKKLGEDCGCTSSEN